jgi:hypothetical protein
MADHDIGDTRLRSDLRPWTMHAAVRYSPLSAGPLERAQHVIGVIHPGEVRHLGYQRESGGTSTAPDVEHGCHVGTDQLQRGTA